MPLINYLFGTASHNIQTISTHPLFNILFILVIVWTVGIIFERFGLPLVVGELAAGLLIGPSFLNWVSMTPTVEVLSQLGMFFIIFYAGLETDPKRLRKTAKQAVAIGALGTILPFALGLAAAMFVGCTFFQALLIGAAISGTSMVTKTRILDDFNILKTKLGYNMMGAAVVDNVFTFFILTLVIKSIKVGSLTASTIFITLFEILAFFGITLYIGFTIYPKVGQFFASRRGKGFTFALLVGFLFAMLAEAIQLHFIVGAYLAGLFVREEIMSRELYQKMHDRFIAIAHGFLGPIFIFSVAFKVSFGVFKTHLLFLILLFLAAFIGKLVGAALAARWSGFSREESLAIGFGMNGRGTVELILAMVGVQLGILTNVHLSVLAFVAFMTTMITPFGLNLVVKRLGKKALAKA